VTAEPADVLSKLFDLRGRRFVVTGAAFVLLEDLGRRLTPG
jgi:hypothetical protein